MTGKRRDGGIVNRVAGRRKLSREELDKLFAPFTAEERRVMELRYGIATPRPKAEELATKCGDRWTFLLERFLSKDWALAKAKH